MKDKMLTAVLAIAEEAGTIALKYFRKQALVEQKADSTPVTQADHEMDRFIHEQLGYIDSSIPIMSEEAKNADYKDRQLWHKLWIVDPLDGTKHFIADRKDYSVNIALVIHGRPLLSVVLAPSMKLCYYAIRGQGAFRCDPDQDRILKCQQTRQRPLRVAISHGTPGKKTRSFLQKCGDYQLVRLGSSLKQCWIAEGRIDVYPRFGKTSEWDTAAAQLVLEEAGGSIVDSNGNSLVYNKAHLVNPEFIAHAPWYQITNPWYTEDN